MENSNSARALPSGLSIKAATPLLLVLKAWTIAAPSPPTAAWISLSACFSYSTIHLLPGGGGGGEEGGAACCAPLLATIMIVSSMLTTSSSTTGAAPLRPRQNAPQRDERQRSMAVVRLPLTTAPLRECQSWCCV